MECAVKKQTQVVVLEKSLSTGAWQELFRIGRERNWRLLDLRFSGNSVPRGLQPVGAFVNRLPDDPFVQRLLEADCHVVRLGLAHHRMDPMVPAVVPDLIQTGALAAEHFAERGFRQLAFVASQPWGVYERLYRGFQEKAKELGCSCHEYHWAHVEYPDRDLVEQLRYQKRFKLFKKWLSSVPKPIGLLAFSDERACLYARMCLDAGFNVPDDIGILGMGNDESICETVYPSISSIIINEKTIIEKAVKIFNQLSSGKTPAETTVLVPSSRIAARQSTNTFAAKDPGVAKACRFMMDHYAEPISIGEITLASGMSRAKLFLTFDKDLGQTPGTILTRIRIDKAKQMLRGTREKINTVAEACGFGSPINIYHHFKKQLGMSPAAFRKTIQ